MTLAPCARPVAPDEIDGQTVICGNVSVPIDHRAPESDRITIAFNLYKAHSLTPEPDPVIYLHGGPGSGTVSHVAKTIGYFEHLRGRRDIIAIDERGVDSSAPEMDCYTTLGAQLAPVVDQKITGNAAPTLQADFINGCLAELDAKGIDYTLINTEQNAMDVPAVLSALGYESYNLYGISYGTKLTMEILRQDPPGIRSAIIDGNAPPWLPLYSMFWQSHSAPIQLSLAPCEGDPVCAEAYPDITARTFALMETLGETPVDGPKGPVDGGMLYEMIDGRVNMKGDYHALTPYIPLMVTQLEQGDTTLFDQITAGELPPKPATADAETLRAAALARGLNGTEMAQVNAMLEAAEHIRIAQGTVERAARLLEGDLDQEARGTDLAEIFDNRLAAAIKAIPDDAARLAVGRDYLDLRFADPSVDGLLTLIEAHLEGSAATDLSALARQLDAAELARVYELIRVDNEATVKQVEGSFQTYLYACQEDFSDGWNSVQKFRDLMAEDGAWGPGMQEALAGYYDQRFIAVCALFDKHPREDWTSVGSTDRPVLAMNGELDTQTAGIWGALAVQDYSDATLVMLPESGHGTIRFSQCAKDITAAFIEAPESDLDTSCVKDLRLPVMLPDGTMHPLPY
ncbi:alpha/beta hydrolase [Sulfitobacter porphyrae]|uniref:Alpha/beta hydrolase n=1 Tax=Sulfitobacter porphyrae TaxID=1246864 RepID=A0ABW2B4W1_9RHOB